MKVKAKRLFSNPVFGNVNPGDVITVSDETYKHLLDLGLVETIEAPVKKAAPKKTPKKGK